MFRYQNNYRPQSPPNQLPWLANPPRPPYLPRMITRSDIIWLGLSAGVTGGLVGGLLLGIGLSLAAQGVHLGWLFLMPAAPLAGMVGWLLARRLARQLPQ